MPTSLEIQTAEPAHIQIRNYYHKQIRTGVLKPGDALPSTQELAAQWKISCTAVQTALSSLTSAGILERTPRRGTFVSTANRKGVIGVLIGPGLVDEAAHFYRALLNGIQGEISDMQEHWHWTCRAYDGLTQTKNADTRILQFHRDLENYSFKGLIEIAPGANWLERGLRQARLPVVNNVTDVILDLPHFYEESFRYAAGQGRGRIAVLNIEGPYLPPQHPVFQVFDVAETLRLQHPEIITLVVKGSLRQRQKMIHEQMVRLASRWRAADGSYIGPSAMIAGDDIAMQAVALSLIQTGIRVPDELLLVCESTDENHLYYGIPVTRYAFSVNQMASQFLEVMWKRITREAFDAPSVAIKGRIIEDGDDL